MKKVLLPLLILIAASSFLMAVESSPSAIVGYVKYPCVTEAGGLNMIALPLDSGYANASDLDTAFPGMMDAISYWDNTTQSWVEADNIGFWSGDFAVAPGLPLLVNATADFNFYSMGTIPTVPSYSFLPGLNTAMIPLNHSELTLASEFGDAVGVVDAVSYWDGPTQSWVEADNIGFWSGDFPVTIGMPLLANAFDTTTWPGAKNVKTVKTLKAQKASK
jgi:hypothetical protein